MTQSAAQSAQSYMDDPRNADVLVYVNGDFFRRDEARISVFDSGFALGDGVWEGLRLVNGKLISLERSEEHTSELQSLMRISYAVFCLKKKTIEQKNTITQEH